MSLRSVEQLSDTDGRSYRRAFWHNQRTRRRLEEERKRRDDAADRRLNPAGPGLPEVVPPGKTRTNPWTDESVLDMWQELTFRRLPGIDPDGSLSLSQFVRLLDVGGVSIKAQFQVPFPDLPIQQLTTSDDALANQNYVVKLWNIVSDQGQGKFDAASLRDYLVSPLEDALGLKVIATNARISTLPALNLLV